MNKFVKDVYVIMENKKDNIWVLRISRIYP